MAGLLAILLLIVFGGFAFGDRFLQITHSLFFFASSVYVSKANIQVVLGSAPPTCEYAGLLFHLLLYVEVTRIK